MHDLCHNEPSKYDLCSPQVSSSSVARTSDLHTEGYGFNSCWGLRFFLAHDKKYNIFYYLDESVLVENRPLVNFIVRNFIQDSSGVLSISSLVRILMTSIPALTLLLVQKCSCLYNKKKITRWLEAINNFLMVKSNTLLTRCARS